jgi:hypothetical protein
VDPYLAVAALAQEELDLVCAGHFDALDELDQRRRVVMAALPAVPPPSATELLQRAAVLQHQVTDALLIARAGAESALDRLQAGRTTVEGYRLSTGAQAPTARADYRR